MLGHAFVKANQNLLNLQISCLHLVGRLNTDQTYGRNLMKNDFIISESLWNQHMKMY